MNVTDKISTKNRLRMSQLHVECQVLANLLNERRAVLSKIVQEVKLELTPSPNLYDLGLNPATNTWELKLKSEVITTPGNNHRVN